LLHLYDSNGSLFQVVFTRSPLYDNHLVVFGCLASPGCYEVLMKINALGSATGKPLEEVRIVDCGIAFGR
jgi:cyclophilin family peptidyl-prolyl cis-trans isomerase